MVSAYAPGFKWDIQPVMETHFTKMHGLGNDFLIFDERTQSVSITPKRAAALADRRTGIGCDQLICLQSAEAATAYMRIYNQDGSEAEVCGNATRCVADLLFRTDGSRQHLIRTAAGDLNVEILGQGSVRVNMGQPAFTWDRIPLAHFCDTVDLDISAGLLSHPAACSMGNPHITFFTENVDLVPLTELGADLEHHPIFPQRANIGVAQVLDRTTIRVQVWERGAGLTRACGSGACAAVVNGVRRGVVDRHCNVILDGGILEIDWTADDRVLMTGASAISFRGTVDLATVPA